MAVKLSGLALLPIAILSCGDPVAPVPQPPLFSYDLAITDSVTASFIGLTEGVTIDDGFARGTTPSGPLVATDATTFMLISEGDAVGLVVRLLGPFEVGTYKRLRDDEAIHPAAKRFEVGFSLKTGPSTFRHYRGISGAVTVTMNDFDKRIVSFSFEADSAELIDGGASRGLVASPIQISATLTERPRF